MADFKYSAGVDINLNVKGMNNQLKDLQKQLQQISNMKIDIGTGNLTADIEKASEAAMKLSAHLATATNPQTGNLDFTKFYTSIQKSGASLQEYGQALQNMGPAGQKAFVSLADSISKAEIPLKRTSKLVDGMWDNLKKTIGWQMSSSIVHGFIGSMQQAVGYAKDLNKSLTDIRIVTGASTDQMAQFAKEANKAAKNLSTTTTDYTRASLIYYQQGLSDQEVKARTETTIKMANATGTSAQTVSDQMTAIWNNFDNGTKSLTHYADVMTALGAATASSTDEIAEGLQKFASVSDTVGLSYEYAASALATVTSTTRESADIVGNSFKTLFSRIQGLQLGETLEDGTDLNKYSSALAKVGINIKDASGQMKDMDNILDEMGMKWQTLSKDQQFALAQTVAGVRQYTQLIALMDNWDYFQENLNTANQSEGTLDTQAAIYATSWEAASNRVRASWEGLWDNLISSDGFIDMLNGLSGFIDILDQMISGMGGASGALLTFGGVLTTVFNKQIATGIRDISYSIGMLFPSTRKNILDEQKSFIEQGKEALDKNYGISSENRYENQARKKSLSDSLDMSLAYAENKSHMNAEQQLMEQMYAQQAEQLSNARIKAGQQLDQANKQVGESFFSFYDRDFKNNILESNQQKPFETESLITTQRIAALRKEQMNILDELSNLETESKSKKETAQRKKSELDILETDPFEREKKKKEIDDQIKQAELEAAEKEKQLNNKYSQTQDQIKTEREKKSKIFGEEDSFDDWHIQQRSDYEQRRAKKIEDLETQVKDLEKDYDLSVPIDKLDQKKNKQQIEDRNKAQELRQQISQLQEPLKVFNRENATYADTMRAQSDSFAKLKNVFSSIESLGDGPKKAEALMDGLVEFGNSAANNQKASQFIKDLQDFAEGSMSTEWDNEKFAQLTEHFDAFIQSANNSMATQIYENMQQNGYTGSLDDVQLMMNAYQQQSFAKQNYNNSMNPINDNSAARLKNMQTTMRAQEGAEKIALGAAGAMELAAAGQAVQSFTTALTTGSATLSSSIASLVSVFAQGASGFSSLLTAFSGLSAGLAIGIPVILTAITAIASAVKGYQDGQRQLENERNERTIEETEIIKDRLNANKALIRSMNDSIAAYENTVAQYNKGQVTLEEKNQAQSNLIKTVQESSGNYSPQVISNILAGDTAAAQRQMYRDRSNEIQQEFDAIDTGKKAAGELMMHNSGMHGFYGEYGQKFLDVTMPTIINSGIVSWDDKSKEAVSFLETSLEDIIPQYVNEHGVEVPGIKFGYGDAINLNDDILSDPEKFIEVYDLLKTSLTDLAAEGYSDTDFYKNLEKFIVNNSANVEKYKQSAKDITALQAEKAAIDAEFFAVDNLQDYHNLRKNLIESNSGIEGFQEQLDIYLNSLANLQNSEQGNIPAIYKALEGAQADTIRSGPKGKSLGLESGLDMQTMLDLYNSMGNDLFSINFKAMSTDAISQLKNTLEGMTGDLTLEAIITAVLKDGGVNSELMSILRSAQALADANTIKINLEIVSNFDPETDLFDAKKRQEFLDAYNEIMGNKESDADYVDSNDLSLMTSDDISDMQFQSTQIGRSAQIEDAQGRVAEWTNIANDLIEIQSQASQAETDAYNALTGKMGNTDFADMVSENARDISRYSDLQEAVEAGKATLDDINELNTLRSNLSEEGLVDAGGNLEDGIPEVIEQIDALAEAQNNLAGVNEQVATASSELAAAQSDSANAHLAQQELIQREAEYYNVDMDAVKRFAKELADSNRVVKRADETTEAFNNRLLQCALDYQENTEGLKALQDAYKDYNSAAKKGDAGAQEKAFNNIRKAIQKITKMPLNKITKEFVDQAKASGALEKALKGDVKAIKQLEDAARESIMLDPNSDIGGILSKHFGGQVDQVKDFVSQLNQAMGEADIGQMFSDVNANLASQIGQVFKSAVDALGGGAEGVAAATALFNNMGIGVENMGSANAEVTASSDIVIDNYHTEGDGENKKTIDDGEYVDTTNGSGEATGTGFKFFNLGGGGGGSPGGGGGGGGGGGPKEPKKVANKRKSQTVKRYKRNDAKRSSAEKSKKSAENQKDYLYGESKIAQMEKINKLAEKEAKITADRIKESRKYLVEDRENLIKYMQKYGFEAEFDADGFLTNYEEAWTAVYEEIAALYEDNLLTEEEEKIEEDLNIKLEELEGALEDYENSLSELADDIEKWEETLYEMFDNKIEQMEHKVEFKLELDEDSLTYIDFLIENLGDSAVRAIDKIDLIAEKTGYLFNSIQTAYEGVEEIYALSDDPLHLFATGGADIDGLLTESQVEALRGQADSLQDFADQLRDIRDTIQEQVAEVFDMWTEKVNHNISTLEHYGSVMEYFKGIIDLTGNDIFGLSDEFVRAMESAQINQSIDQMEANKAYYEELQEMRTNVEAELYKAQASGDAERIAYWEEHLRTVEEEMQTAQDSMLAALESTLSMITDQFTATMEDAVDTFGKSLYASGGLEGLSNDYSLMREQADLMAEDYDKIYNLSKLTRNINKTLDDTNIIAGKQRLNKLLQEVNSLQADNVELSKFDLEYLQAKYELYLAEVELRNAQANKDTVTLTKDSEGNYSYVYTVNEDKVDEAQQKYEDALYEMQNMNHEYIEEMSAGVIETMQAMNDEIASLEISDFANLEEYNARVQEIREKYFAQLKLQESELNKAIGNNQELYETDWKAYSEMTGYKISADKEWINSFRETTLGYLTESKSLFSDFSETASTYADTLVESLSTAATGYFSQIEEALSAYGTSIANFGSHITGTYKDIQDSSDKTKDKTIEMAKAMKEAFEEVVNTVGNWQDTDGLEITEMLDKIATYLKEIFDAINTSANIKTDSGGSTIGQQEATRLLSSGFEYNGETYSFGSWSFNKRGDLDINDGNGFSKKGSNLIDYHAYLAEQVQDALDAYYSNPDDATLKAVAENLIKRYWAYRSVIDRVYDPGEIEANVPKSFDTGGYTGEWGSEGRLAMLHQKEIVLNADDTANFLQALNISRQLIEMIEMNARASSLGLGEMVASTIKDNSQTIEQQVYITAEFPEATNHSEIEEAFDNIINLASQYAFRRD